jgi:hypothetical protein
MWHGSTVCLRESDRPFAQGRNLQHQQHQQAPAQSAALAKGGQARHRLPAKAQMRRRHVSGWTAQAGVAILALGGEPILTALPGDSADAQSRYMEE